MGSVAVIPDCSGSAFVTVLILCIVGWLSLLALAAKAFLMQRELKRMRTTVYTAISGELSSSADGRSRAWSKEALKGAQLMSPKQLQQLCEYQTAQQQQQQQQQQAEQSAIALQHILAHSSTAGARGTPVGGSHAQIPPTAVDMPSGSGAMLQPTAAMQAPMMPHNPPEITALNHHQQQLQHHQPLYDGRYIQHSVHVAMPDALLLSAPPTASTLPPYTAVDGSPLPMLMPGPAAHPATAAHGQPMAHSGDHLQQGHQPQVGQVETPPRSQTSGPLLPAAMRRAYTAASSEHSSGHRSNRVSPTQGVTSTSGSKTRPVQQQLQLTGAPRSGVSTSGARSQPLSQRNSIVAAYPPAPAPQGAQVVMLPAVTPEMSRSNTSPGKQRYSGTAPAVPDLLASGQQVMQVDRLGSSPIHLSDNNASPGTSHNASSFLSNSATGMLTLSTQPPSGDGYAGAGAGPSSGQTTPPAISARAQLQQQGSMSRGEAEIQKIDLLGTYPADSSRARRAAAQDVSLNGLSTPTESAPVLAELSPVMMPPAAAVRPAVWQSSPNIMAAAQAGPTAEQRPATAAAAAGKLVSASHSPFASPAQGGGYTFNTRTTVAAGSGGLSHPLVSDGTSSAPMQPQQYAVSSAQVTVAGSGVTGAQGQVPTSDRGGTHTVQGQGRPRVTFAGEVPLGPVHQPPVTAGDSLLPHGGMMYNDSYLVMPVALRQYSLGTELGALPSPAPAPRLSAHTLSLLRKSRRSVGGSVSSLTGQGSSAGGSPDLQTYRSIGTTGSGIFRIRAPSASMVVGSSSPPPPPPVLPAQASPAHTASMRRAHRGESDSGASQHSHMGSAPHSPSVNGRTHRYSGSLPPTRSEPRPPRPSQDQVQLYGQPDQPSSTAAAAGTPEQWQHDEGTVDRERAPHSPPVPASPNPLVYLMGGGGPFASSVMAALLEDDEDEESHHPSGQPPDAPPGTVGGPPGTSGAVSEDAVPPLPQSVARGAGHTRPPGTSTTTRPSRPSPQATSPFTQPAAQVALFAPQQQQAQWQAHRAGEVTDLTSNINHTSNGAALDQAGPDQDHQQHQHHQQSPASSSLALGRRVVAKRLSESAREASSPHDRHSSGQLEMQVALSSGAEEGGSSSYDNVTASGWNNLAQLASKSHSSSIGTQKSHPGGLHYNTSVQLGEPSVSQGELEGEPVAMTGHEGTWPVSHDRDQDRDSTGSRDRDSGGYARPAPALVLPLQRPHQALQLPLSGGGGVAGAPGSGGGPGGGAVGGGPMLLSPSVSRQSWNARSSTRLWMTSTASKSFNHADRVSGSGRTSVDGSDRGSLPRAGASENVGGAGSRA